MFRVESKVFEKAKSLKASEDKFPWTAISFSGYLKQFVELYGKIHSMFYRRFSLCKMQLIKLAAVEKGGKWRCLLENFDPGMAL